MKLGLKRNEVRIVPYTEEWHDEFLRMKKEIHEQTNIAEERIEHFGSTSIKDMPAKPIIDILVGVDDLANLDPSIRKGLRAIGVYQLKVTKPGEVVFAKFTDDTYEEKTHYVRLVEYEKEYWKDFIFFRDYLSANENARKEYLNLKQEYLKMHSTGINEYANHKEGFVKYICKKRIRLEEDG